MGGFAPIIILFIIIGLVSDLSKKRRQIQERQSKAAPGYAPHSAPSAVNTAATPAAVQNAAQELDPEYSNGWDSETEFHEGEEDPSHDHGGTLEGILVEEPAETVSEEAKEMLKGIVWSEILTRRKK